MSEQDLTHQVDAFVTWKKSIIRELTRYRTWLKDNHLSTDDIDDRLNSAQGNLQSDKITLAFVGEFSRGKTELINALFFAQYGKRMLPSTPGRTTMCPTELFFDLQTRESYISLLPVESRSSNNTIKQLKGQPHAWKYIKLDLGNSEQISAALSQVSATKDVDASEAIALGFELDSLEPSANNADKVTIPTWRHALISFEHPLLRQGLTIIDTPGLNALGCEPELTFSLLPDAQAVLFMLGADTGVTQTDLIIWQNHIKQLCGHLSSSMYAVLNKVDLLWNDPDGQAAETAYLENIIESTAKQLDIPVTGILPLSAKGGLNGKILGDAELLIKSQLPRLERLLSESIVQGKEQTIQESIVNDVIGMLSNSRSLLKARLDEMKEQRKVLQSDLTDKHTVFGELNTKTRADQARYQRQLIILKKNRNMLQQQVPQLIGAVRPESFDLYLHQATETFAGSWTNRGVKKAVDSFYDSIKTDLISLKQHYLITQEMVTDAYEGYQKDNPDQVFVSPALDVEKHLARLEELRQQTHIMYSSMLNIFRQNKNIAKRFTNTVAEEAGALYRLAQNDARIWCKNSFTPILRHAQEQKKLLDHQLTVIKSMSTDGSNLKDNALKLQQIILKLEKQMVQADSIMRALCKPAPSTIKQKVAPIDKRLKAADAAVLQPS